MTALPSSPREESTRIAILSDIHANLAALEAVLKKIDEVKVGAIHCLGDIGGYGPFPNECIELVRTHCSSVVKGNHDSGIAGETDIQEFNRFGQEAIQWTIRSITSENLEYLRGLPLVTTREDMTFVHASPMRPEEWTYILSLSDAMESFKAFHTTHCFIGHTHLPVVVGEDLKVNAYSAGVRTLINVGSVGQPRDGNPDAAFGILDRKERTYSLIRVPYDVDTTARAIRKAGLPSFLAKRLFKGV